MPNQNQKTKMYLAIGLIMIVIITAWILNLKNYFHQDFSGPTDPDQTLTKILNNFSDLAADVKNIKNGLNQSATTTGSSLQGGPDISPDQLDEITERLKLTAATSTPTTTPTTTHE